MVAVASKVWRWKQIIEKKDDEKSTTRSVIKPIHVKGDRPVKIVVLGNIGIGKVGCFLWHRANLPSQLDKQSVRLCKRSPFCTWRFYAFCLGGWTSGKRYRWHLFYFVLGRYWYSIPSKSSSWNIIVCPFLSWRRWIWQIASIIVCWGRCICALF